MTVFHYKAGLDLNNVNVLKRSIHRDMKIACVQKPCVQTSEQDLPGCHDYRIIALNNSLSTAVVVLSEDTAFKQRVNRGAAALDSTIKNNLFF